MTNYQVETRECSVQKLLPKLAQALTQYVTSNDDVLICCETKVKEKIGLGDLIFGDVYKPPYYSAEVITQSHLLSASYYKLSGDISTTSLLLNDIASFQETSDKYYYNVVAHGSGDTGIHCSFGTRQIAGKFASILGQAIERAKSIKFEASHSSSSGSIEERLRRLTQLHKDGLVSDAEFQKKRADILRQL